ncbi:MAG: 4'-phosphopantetheinyl transferase superfamily protein [Bacteroidota bacterium]
MDRLGLSDDVVICVAQGGVELPILTEAERARMASFGHQSRQELFALGRTAARTLLGAYLHCDPLDVPLVVADDGAPEVEAHPIEVSLSHTLSPAGTPLAVAAIASQQLGVDIEALKPRRNDLYRFLLHEAEYPLLHDLAEHHAEPPSVAIVRCWAMKEAVLKGLRTGFRLSPKKLRLTLMPDSTTPYVSTAQVTGSNWRLHTTEVHGCALAVALPL